MLAVVSQGLDRLEKLKAFLNDGVDSEYGLVKYLDAVEDFERICASSI